MKHERTPVVYHTAKVTSWNWTWDAAIMWYTCNHPAISVLINKHFFISVNKYCFRCQLAYLCSYFFVSQTAAWLTETTSVSEEVRQHLFEPTALKTLLLHHRQLGTLSSGEFNRIKLFLETKSFVLFVILSISVQQIQAVKYVFGLFSVVLLTCTLLISCFLWNKYK